MIIISQVIFVCNGCSEMRVLESSDVNLKFKKGILTHNDSPFNGTLVSYYLNDSLKSQTQYVNGNKHGNEKQWYPNGNTLIVRFYEAGLKIGIHKSWWEDGSQKFEYHFNEKGEFDGLVKEWYKSGQVFRDFNYVKGKEVGSQRLYKSDGSIKANYEVINNERYGLIGLKKCYTVNENSDAF